MNTRLVLAATLLSLALAWPARATEVTPAQIKTATAKALPLLEKSAITYTQHRQCFSCHHQTMPMLALVEAKSRGWEVDAGSIQKLTRFTAKSLKGGEKNYLKGQGQGGRADTAGSALLALELG